MASASETNNRLVIFRGDDTGGAFGRSLVFTIRTDGGASLDGCRAEWEFDGIVKRFDAPLIDGETREIFYSHNETRCMRLGVRFGTLRIIDAAGKVRTFNNTKPVEVTDIVSRVYPGSSAATVTISAGVTWDGIAGKPKLVKTINGEEPDDDGNIEVASGGTVKSATVNGGEKVMPDASGNLALTVESVPSDYDDVRTNAATGAAHAAKRGSGSVTDANPHGTRIQDIDYLGNALTNLESGLASASAVATDARNIALGHKYDTTNPHATTAEQVGFRVVELVVEGDAKKLYLMLNGERTTERVTSYATLLAMAKRGLVRMYYNAVGGTGRKALYTAHMVDDNGTPAMRFDATGTLGEKVYTRSIALTKSGEDGIAVTIGALTEIAKNADVPALTTTIAASSSGKAADASAVATELAKKRDKTDNICTKDEVGKWSIPAPINIYGPTHSFEGTQPYFSHGKERWEWFSDRGYCWIDTYSAESSTSLSFELSPDFGGGREFSSSKVTLAKANESYVTPTGVENLTPKPTTTIAESSSGKAADAAAVATELKYKVGFYRDGVESGSPAFGVDERGAFFYLMPPGGGFDYVYRIPILTQENPNATFALTDVIPTDAKITTLAEASIKDKAMPTEGAVEGSVSAKITALETAITGVAADLAEAIGEEA